ncbi:Diaminopimelate epimerase-like protein [Mycena indigotica]|uniref:Diaminopimelate epimerase-like protein n=1 Tax=Mycena indigotica TaxID=2126181 RepID=A0A8H6S601_9AGAR|nr:Diaminopimelate epimerase-like protein [Mycena indigotica]KAF7292973.1 Diaminopimelate epimerase-like protein [Mycena indigotica]
MSPTHLSYAIYDAFTSRRFGGNPASIVVLERDHGLTDDTLQLIGREFQLSETAFLVPLEDHTNDAPHFSIRWFTPQLEAPLCGHATLASAIHLHAAFPHLRPPYRFESRLSGQFTSWFPDVSPDALKSVSKTGRGFLVEVAESVDVANVQPDLSAIARDITGQCVITAPHTPTDTDPSRVHSRMFAPGSGINEDPVTGSAHTRIVPYWLSKWGGASILCRQVSARVGELDAVWLRDAGRVLLRGKGVKVAEGTLFI